MSIRYVARQAPDGTWVAGYSRPTQPGIFMIMMIGTTQGSAQAEADRLNREQAARQMAVDAEALAEGQRRVVHGFYDDGVNQ